MPGFVVQPLPKDEPVPRPRKDWTDLRIAIKSLKVGQAVCFPLPRGIDLRELQVHTLRISRRLGMRVKTWKSEDGKSLKLRRER